jgi:Tfp pilus assembly protein PilF
MRNAKVEIRNEEVGLGEVRSRASEIQLSNFAFRISHFAFLLPAFVLAVTFVAYAGALGYAFVYDDIVVIVQNPTVHSWHSVPRFFTEHLWGFKYAVGSYYRPIFLVWLTFNHWLFGLNPLGYHLTTILLHVGVTLLVFLLVRKLTGDQATAAIASLVFGLHPAHIEAVAWIAGATESLLAILFLGSFVCYVQYREASERKARWLTAALVLAVLTVLAKEQGVVLAAVVFAYEFILKQPNPAADGGPEEPAARSWRRIMAARLREATIRTLPFLVVTALYLSLRVIVLGAIGRSLTPISVVTMILTWPSLLWSYIKILIWPVGLSLFYDAPYITQPTAMNFWLPFAAVIVVALALWGMTKRSAMARFAVVWLVLPIVPLLNLGVFPEGDISHDRYLYLPSVGFSIIVALGLRAIHFGKSTTVGLPSIQVLATAVVACALGLATAFQHINWASSLLLYDNAVKVAPNNRYARNNLGTELLERGRTDEAGVLFREVVDRYPNFFEANYNLGCVLYGQKMYEDAERTLSRAIEIKPLRPDTYYMLGVTRLDMKHLDEAESPLREAIRLRPDASFYHFALGSWYQRRGDLRAALAEFEVELINNPNFAEVEKQIKEIRERLDRDAKLNADGQGLPAPPGRAGKISK